MALNCLVGCVTTFDRTGIRKTINSPIIMPYVEARILGGGKTISVSNWSSANTKAVIKSFSFGLSNGCGCLIEVVDEEGGNFDNFFRKISVGNIDAGANKYLLRFRFGWAWTNCDGTANTYGPVMVNPQARLNSNVATRSTEHKMNVTNISINVSNGAYKYSIEGQDLAMTNFTTRLFKVYGTDRNKIRLVEAIRQCLKEINITPKFLQLDGGAPVPLKFDKTGNVDENLGPLGRWETLGRNPIAACRDWISSYCSQRKKGIIVFFSPTDSRVLMFVETNQVTCNEQPNTNAFNLGTYILNGSACSPVISFNPQIQYNGYPLMTGTSGIMPGSLQGKMKRETGPDPCFEAYKAIMEKISKRQGLQSTWVSSDNDYDNFRDQSSSVAAANRMRNMHVNRINPPYTAELRIQGDPSFTDPIFYVGYYITLVYFNPFRIGTNRDNDGNNYCEWLATSECNAYLSSSNWMIQGVSHEIKEGMFTTTLKLFLALPGTDIVPTNTIGGLPISSGAPTDSPVTGSYQGLNVTGVTTAP